VPLWKRPFVASDTLLFYLRKLVWPSHLIPIHGRVNEALFSTATVWFTLPLIAGLAALFVRLPACARLGAAWWALALLPVLGLTPFYYQFLSNVADRYAYVAVAGAGIALTSLLTLAAARFPRYAASILVVTATGMFVFGALAFRQAGYWRNSESLWLRQRDVNPNVGLARFLLGSHYYAAGQLDQAAAEFRETIRIDPSTPEAYSSLMDISTDLGQPDEVKRIAELALQRLEPTSIDKYLVRGHAQLRLAQYLDAAHSFRAVAAGLPDDAESRRMLGQALFRAEKYAEAEEPLRESIRLNERVWQTHETLSTVLLRLGRRAEALQELEKAAQLAPDHPRLNETLARLRQQ
jgi:tetratricopeptide (TPR) repeat protein